MSIINNFRKYYSTGKYKGFRKIREHKNKQTGVTQVTFSDGEKKISALGKFKEAALKKVFAQIDKFTSNKKSNKYQSINLNLDYQDKDK